MIEGVMMRGQAMYAMAVRNPEGGITVEDTPVASVSGRLAVLRLPIIRGAVAFVDSLYTGTKSLMRSAELAGDSVADEEPGRLEKYLTEKWGEKKLYNMLVYLSVALSLVLSVCLFMLLPVWVGNFFAPYLPGPWALSLIESVIKLVIFFGYLFCISQMKDIQRVFQYHGAEHKTINCFEAGAELTVENVRRYTRIHKRCGTSFLFLVMAVSIVIFFFVRTDTLWLRMLSRILLIPVVAGVSYEILKWAGRSDSALVRIVSAPGMALQKWTTKEPENSQMEVAIAALNRVLEVEGSEGADCGSGPCPGA